MSLTARARLVACFVSLSLLACVSPPDPKDLPRIEARFGEPAQPKPEAPSRAPAPAPKSAQRTIDPPPQRTRAFVRVSLKFESGKILWLASEPVSLDQEKSAARRFGRFALVAERAGELVERVHFDFPLLARTDKESEVLESGLSTKTHVLFPDLQGEAELFLVDEKGGTRAPIPWRSVSPESSPAPPEGTGDAPPEGAREGAPEPSGASRPDPQPR